MTNDIKKVELNSDFYKVHKSSTRKSEFGLDSSNELIGGGFGLYSTVNMHQRIGPIKTQFYRIGFMKRGSVDLKIGLENYHPSRNSMVFGFPGQTFSIFNQSNNFLAYYLLFTSDFMKGSMLLNKRNKTFPFMSYSGIQSFKLNADEADEIEKYILNIDNEIKNRKSDLIEAIQLIIQLILIKANRSYDRQMLSNIATTIGNNDVFRRFIKLVNEHFLSVRKVSDYAEMMNISSDHLNRMIKQSSSKTAHELIDEMLIIEAKAHLLHTDLSVSEIAYKLEFSDPSHFNKFFKKQTGITPLQFKTKSE